MYIHLNFKKVADERLYENYINHACFLFSLRFSVYIQSVFFYVERTYHGTDYNKTHIYSTIINISMVIPRLLFS